MNSTSSRLTRVRACNLLSVHRSYQSTEHCSIDAGNAAPAITAAVHLTMGATSVITAAVLSPQRVQRVSLRRRAGCQLQGCNRPRFLRLWPHLALLEGDPSQLKLSPNGR